MAVVWSSANHNLATLYESVFKQGLLFQRTSLLLHNRLRVSLTQHKQIFPALKSGRWHLVVEDLPRSHVLDEGCSLI